MKTNKIIVSLTALAIAAWVTGCKEQTKPADGSVNAGESAKEAAPSVAEQTTEVIKTATAAVKESGAQVIEQVKTAGTNAVQAVTEKAKEVVAPLNLKAQGLIDAAKSLISEGKFADALAKLNATEGETLSTDQISMVDSLKAQIAKATEAAGKAVNDATKSATDAVNSFLKK